VNSAVLKFSSSKKSPHPNPPPGKFLYASNAAGVNPYDTYMRAARMPSNRRFPTRPALMAQASFAVIGDEVKK